MRLTRHAGAALVCAAVLIAGCSRRTPPVARVFDPVPAAPVEAPAPPPPPPPAALDAEPESPASLTEDEIFARKTLDELNAEQPLVDAFFDYDQFTLREDARIALRRNAEWLQRWTSTGITIEGHCDSRGTSEYNLALGERRAGAVREYLVSLGIAGDRLVTVSLGEEAPTCAEDFEACWQRNRRGHFVITAK